MFLVYVWLSARERMIEMKHNYENEGEEGMQGIQGGKGRHSA